MAIDEPIEDNIVVAEEVNLEKNGESTLSYQDSIFEARREKAKKGLAINLIFSILFGLILAGCFVLLILVSFNAEVFYSLIDMFFNDQPPGRAIIALVAIFGIVISGVLFIYFLGHLAGCIKDIRDPAGRTKKDEAI